MSDDLRVAPSNLYRNHQDLRVRNAQALALDVSNIPKVEFPILTFEDNIFPGSPCPKENVIQKMDSPHLYEEVNNGDKKFPFNLEEGLNLNNLIDLDPTLEDSVDLQNFINSGTVTGTKVLEQLLSGGVVKESDLVSTVAGGCDPVTDICTNNNSTDIDPVIALTEKEFMTNPEKLTNLQGFGQVLTIKTEDLGLWDISSGQLEASSDNQVSSTVSNTPPESPVDPPYSPLPRGRPGRKPSGVGPIRNNRKRAVPKDTEEYKEKRARNNIAVRKSRDKAKQKQQETQKRVESLCDENEQLQKKVDLLTKELNVLKGLFINVGVSLPANFEELLGKL